MFSKKIPTQQAEQRFKFFPEMMKTPNDHEVHTSKIWDFGELVIVDLILNIQW